MKSNARKAVMKRSSEAVGITAKSDEEGRENKN